jgi:hypothetical protein
LCSGRGAEGVEEGGERAEVEEQASLGLRRKEGEKGESALCGRECRFVKGAAGGETAPRPHLLCPKGEMQRAKG